MEERKKNAIIVDREQLTDELTILRVRPDSGELPEFVAGQYAEIAIPDEEPDSGNIIAPGTEGGSDSENRPKLIRRAYSIASPPSNREYLEFFITLVPNGALTPQLWNIPVGSKVWLNPKVKGKFTLEPVTPGKDLILVSTGTGLAPFMSMLRQYPVGRPTEVAPPWRSAVVVHCTRLSKDLGYRAELEARAEQEPNFFYIPTVTREPDLSPWTGCRGRVQSIFEEENFRRLTGLTLAPPECQVMMCGNPEMIDSLQAHLLEKGFSLHSKKSPGNIHFERYW